MKLFTVLAGLTFSVIAQANCPNLSGSYLCPSTNGTQAFSVKVSQVRENGFWKYSSDTGTAADTGYVIADGVARVYTNANGPGPLTTTTCEANDVLRMTETVTDSSGTATMTSNVSINAENNLLEAISIQSAQGNFAFNLVCVRH